jgi:hypothetical protein
VIRDLEYLREQADRCRRLAKAQGEAETAETLREMARQYEDLIDEIERDRRDEPPMRMPSNEG